MIDESDPRVDIQSLVPSSARNTELISQPEKVSGSSPLSELTSKLEAILQDEQLGDGDRMVVTEAARNMTMFREELIRRRQLLESQGIPVTKDNMFLICYLENPDPSATRATVSPVTGFSLDQMYDPQFMETDERGRMKQKIIKATNETAHQMLVAMEFMRPGETLDQRLQRIEGRKIFYQDQQGRPTDKVWCERFNDFDGELISFNEHSDPRGTNYMHITSPITGPGVLVRIETDMYKDGDTLRADNTTIKSILFRPDGTGTNESVGEVFIRLAK
jgi:hypothetical protein